MSAIPLHLPGVRPAPGDADFAKAALLVQLVALAAGVAAHEIATRRRDGAVARARQTAMYLAHTGCGWSLSRVGAAFARDRTTAAYACALIEDGRDDAGFDTALGALETMLRAAPEGLLS